MYVFEVIIVLLLAGAGLTALARRLGLPYPALVALAGAGLALVPGTPTLALEPDLALTLFVAPVLLDAAFDSSARDLRADWRIVAGLAIGAVLVTVLVVAGVVRVLVPGMPWAVAVALGAIVAPPDAAAATAVLDQLRPPNRLLVILEGESLFNDAAALLIFRMAVGAATAGTLEPARAIPTLLAVTAGSVALGYALSRLIVPLTGRIRDVPIAVVVQFCGTFAVWIAAERLHLSGILTVVVFAMASARRAGGAIAARVRLPSYAVWEFAVFVLNVLAFILVGFQLKGILGRLDLAHRARYTAIAAAVCAAVVLARLAWVSGAAAISRSLRRAAPGDVPGDDPGASPGGVGLSNRAAAVVGWCGMRGIVTLAAALALPDGSGGPPAFPFRDLLVFSAFAVVLGTLVVQGMTLRPLLRALNLEDDDTVDREVRLARVESLRAAVEATRELPVDELSALLRRRYEVLLRRAEATAVRRRGAPDREEGHPRFDVGSDLVRVASSAARRRLLGLRGDRTIGDRAFQRVEQELDREELDFEDRSGAEEPGRGP